MPRVKFIVDHKVQQHDGNGPLYRAGQVYDLHVSYAEKYKNRGYAVAAVGGDQSGGLFALNPKQTDGDPPPGTVEIADDWRDLKWPEMKALAARLTPEPVRSKDDAVAAIERVLERVLERRAQGQEPLGEGGGDGTGAEGGGQS